jgi:hypothetical protein
MSIELAPTRYPRVLAVVLDEQHIGHVRQSGQTWTAAVATEPVTPLQTARPLDGAHGSPEEAADAVIEAWSPNP